MFNVSVSVANRTVLVSEAIDQTPVDDPEPRGELREWALKALMDMSIVSTTLYRSVVGDAFGSNMQNTFGEVCSHIYFPIAILALRRVAPSHRSLDGMAIH